MGASFLGTWRLLPCWLPRQAQPPEGLSGFFYPELLPWQTSASRKLRVMASGLPDYSEDRIRVSRAPRYTTGQSGPQIPPVHTGLGVETPTPTPAAAFYKPVGDFAGLSLHTPSRDLKSG